jgi:hypothetical protein
MCTEQEGKAANSVLKWGDKFQGVTANIGKFPIVSDRNGEGRQYQHGKRPKSKRGRIIGKYVIRIICP